jgi:hypothetical protein
MADGRIRRSARRGIAAAVLGWLCVAAVSVVFAPGASADSSVTVTIDDITPPLASVDPRGTVTFVNAIEADTVSVSVPALGVLPAQKASATVHRDVAVAFFGDERKLTTGKSTSWTFPQTTNGSITYTFRIVPQSGLAAPVADQVVAAVKKTLDGGGTPVEVPYVVQTIAPDLPNLPSVNVPELPSIEVPDVPGSDQPEVEVPAPGGGDNAPGGGSGDGDRGSVTGPDPIDGDIYTYADPAAPQGGALDSTAGRAFDPSRFASSSGSAGGSPGSGAGGGGTAGTYDGASVPVFGQLAGVDGDSLDDQSEEQAATDRARALPSAALAAVVALATVVAALVSTHRAQRTARR